MSNKATMIVSGIINVNEKEAYTSYVESTGPIFKKSGSNPIAKYPISQVLFGNDEIEFLAIMEFPNLETIQGVFNSEAYKKLLPIREKAFKKLNIYMS
jgi:uncharacterized protein (DUF1330 family)